MAAAPNWLTKFNNALRPQVVKELIGRWVLGEAQYSLFRSRAYVKTVDETIPNYEFWDMLRRGKAKGYSLGGLFARRIEWILATWILGQGVDVTLKDKELGESADYTNGKIADFIASLLDAGQELDEEELQPDRDDRQNSRLMTVFCDTLGLGDQWVIINADGSLSVPSPDTVTCNRDPLDYRLVLSVVITTRTGEYVITDEYRADGRTIIVKRGEEIVGTQTFANLIGRIPVVHFAYGMSGNETYGHPIHEQLKPLYDQYDDLIYKQIDGAKLLGNPLLTFAGMEDINAVQNANQPATADTYLDKDGNEQTRPQLNIDSNAVLLVGKGGSASFTSPPVGFTADTTQALQSLFSLLMYHIGIPDFVWGDEQSSARATSDTQMEQFVKDIIGWQRNTGGQIVKLCKIWLQTKALTDPQIIVGALTITWPELVQEDKEVILKFIDFAKLNALITDETALRLLALVDDAKEEVELAQAEAEEKQAAMMDQETSDFGQRLKLEAKTMPAKEMTAEIVRTDTTVIAAIRELRATLTQL
jgi:hypothetical protein